MDHQALSLIINYMITHQVKPCRSKSQGELQQMMSWPKVIEYFSLDINRRPIMRQEAGYLETIILEGMEDDPIRAKFDDGQ